MATALLSNEAPLEEDQVAEWQLAKKGITLLLNNQVNEAEALFKNYRESTQMYAGYAVAVFMDALMTFEEDKLTLACTTLKELERRCVSESGWLKSMKSKMFSSNTDTSLARSLETQIILADSQVCIAILTFLQQELVGYFKGGWVLRKAWKVYHRAYHDILNLYTEIVGESPFPELNKAVVARDEPVLTPEPSGTSFDWDVPDRRPSAPSNGYKIPHSYTTNFQQRPNSRAHLQKSASVNSSLSNGLLSPFMSLSYFTSTFNIFGSELKTHSIDKETITRLMGAICFGYGLFQLGVSLLPPSLLRFSSIFGFAGNRQSGITNLMYARLGTDMRAPLATLSLLWYHTIVRPFYGLDGSNVQAGVNAALQLIEESEYEFGKSALFLFFKGRVCRLKSDIKGALQAFQASVDNSNQREIKVLAMHEVAWCHLVQLNYAQAEFTFKYLKVASRWSHVFYTYVTIICAGACDNMYDLSYINELKNLLEISVKASPLEDFLVKRYNLFPKNDATLKNTSAIFWKILVYELLYLWNTLASCNADDIQQIIQDCEDVTNEPMLGLSKLIQGSCYCIKHDFGSGTNSFRRCLEMRQGKTPNSTDAHVSAFAQYELGLQLTRNPLTKDEGKSMLQKVSNYKEYDFEQRLTVRIHQVLKQL